MRNLFFAISLALLVSCGKNPSIEQRVDDLLEVRIDKTLLTSFAWLNIARYNPDDTTAMDETVRVVNSMIFSKLDSLRLRSIREQYQEYVAEYDRMFDYILTIFAINCTQPPVIETLYDELKAYGDSIGKPDTWSLRRIQELEPLAADLTKFYRDAGMEEVINAVQPLYDSIGAAYRSLAVQKISDAISFTGVQWDALSHIEKIVILPNLLGPQGEMGPEYRGIKYDIKGPKSQVVFYTHEFVHSIVHPLLLDAEVQERVIRLVESRKDSIVTTKAWGTYAEPLIFFEECLVRALDAHIMNLGEDDGPSKIQTYLEFEESRGFIFCLEISKLLEDFDARRSDLATVIDRLTSTSPPSPLS